MGTDRRLLGCLLALAVLVSAACGSTVPVAQQQAVESGEVSGDDLGEVLPEGTRINSKGQVVNAEGEVIGDAEDFGITTDDPGAAVSGGSSGGGTTGSTGATGSTGGAVAAGKNGPGISATTIKIGVSYADDAEEANRAIGAAGASQINQRRAWEAMIDYINNHGGVNGKKLDPVFHRLSVTSTEPYDQQDQEVCAHWTQDEPVFVADGAFKTDNGLACFEKNGLVTITTNGLRFKSRAAYQRYPHYLEFDGIDNDAIARMYADSMKKMGLFDTGYKLGIVSWDDPEYALPTRNTLIPRLRQLGIKVSEVTYIAVPDSGGQAADPIAQIGNTAVRYKGEGITHVMFMDLGANLAFFFMQAAQRQQYAPRYGLHSGSGGTALADLLSSGGAQEAREQLRDAVAVGWVPTLDVRAEDVPKWAQSPAKKICYRQMREGGVEMDSANARGLAEGVCDAAWTIQATLEAAGSIINQDTWYRGLATPRADNITLTGGMGYSVSPTRRDAIEYAALAKFVSNCVCFRYVTDRFRVPE